MGRHESLDLKGKEGKTVALGDHLLPSRTVALVQESKLCPDRKRAEFVGE